MPCSHRRNSREGAGCSNRILAMISVCLLFFGSDMWLHRCCSHSNPVCKLSWENQIHRPAFADRAAEGGICTGGCGAIFGHIPQTTRMELAWYAVPHLTYHDLVPACTCILGSDYSEPLGPQTFLAVFLKVSLCRFWSLCVPYSMAWQYDRYSYDRSSQIAAYDGYLQTYASYHKFLQFFVRIGLWIRWTCV